jgi:tRNA pseudouridine38-40 synthase
MPVYRLQIEYDGTAFRGWQIQPDLVTVQGALNRALTLVTRQQIRTSGAGRTDSGVHARGQVASFRCEEPVDCRRAVAGIHGICGPEIRVLQMGLAPDAFHARHSAIWREYSYRILDRPSALFRDRAWLPGVVPPLPLLREASADLLGRHDFSSFANASADDQDPSCEILRADWDCWEDGIVFTVRADHFLYRMVRTLVRTLLREAGPGGGGRARMVQIRESRSRPLAAPPAPAKGLYLDRVGYDPPWPPDP